MEDKDLIVGGAILGAGVAVAYAVKHGIDEAIGKIPIIGGGEEKPAIEKGKFFKKGSAEYDSVKNAMEWGPNQTYIDFESLQGKLRKYKLSFTLDPDIRYLFKVGNRYCAVEEKYFYVQFIGACQRLPAEGGLWIGGEYIKEILDRPTPDPEPDIPPNGQALIEKLQAAGYDIVSEFAGALIIKRSDVWQGLPSGTAEGIQTYLINKGLNRSFTIDLDHDVESFDKWVYLDNNGTLWWSLSEPNAKIKTAVRIRRVGLILRVFGVQGGTLEIDAQDETYKQAVDNVVIHYLKEYGVL